MLPLESTKRLTTNVHAGMHIAPHEELALEGDLTNFAFWFQETQYDIERHRAFLFLPDSVAYFFFTLTPCCLLGPPFPAVLTPLAC